MAKTLYVFGDSYSTPHIKVEPKDSFWGLAANDLAVDTIYNFSFSGNCLDNILHVLLNDEFDFNNGYFLIGIPPLIRYSVFNQHDNSLTPNKRLAKYDNKFNETEMYCPAMHNVGSQPFVETFTNDKKYVSYFCAEWNDVINLEKIYLLSSWMLSKNAKFIIVNLSTPIVYQDMWPAGCGIMKKVNFDPHCIIFKDTYQSLNQNDNIIPPDYEEWGWNGHHGPQGNQNWYKKILYNKMQELNWI